MKLWEFLSRESDVPLSRVMAIAAVSGLANALLLAVVNQGAHTVSSGSTTQLFILFGVVISLYIVTQRYILRVASIEVERIIAKLRVKLSQKVRQADLGPLELLGRSRIYASMQTETLTISQSTAPMIIACQGSILIVFSMLYMLILSRVAFFLTVAIVGLGVLVHFKSRNELIAEMHRSTAKENEFFDVLTDLLEGFKEMKLNQARGRDLFAELSQIADDVAETKTKTGVRYADYYIFTQVLFYLLIGAMVFVLPGLSAVYSDQVTQLTAAILFIIGPITGVVGAFPVFRMAEHSIENIARLEAELDQARVGNNDTYAGNGEPPPVMTTIELNTVRFSYTDRDGNPLFTVGPLDLTLKQGEVLLIVGGNGSGKSTLLKLLTSLYYPSSGEIRVNGLDARTVGYRTYRELFSAIFADYHLFERLYGVSGVDDKRVVELLRLMGLERKTTWRDGRFANQELSTGQRKRLALIISLLEDKQIYVFDEWAADQDPSFREFFYETLLPEMKRGGKTVVAATHDERYFHVGDRVLKMEAGRFIYDSDTTKIGPR
ncbi:MAG: cyclic peptide export ABC transporter [Vicinamibacterales bacterium]|nr:cyclic peptide export ABC transporter [Vicinamibacterales bacterium]HJN43317.1 cyclic peptide export ABC transporter [Vicinamibacterales bacterium]